MPGFMLEKNRIEVSIPEQHHIAHRKRLGFGPGPTVAGGEQ
ncbi:hypothetical protein FHU41_000016 [Psychromicrobium silvestre]|uniref:Uncharacterized protein n=1 Tax=Psychromicrobium silvestre TaxID=1645614 RepID=A0A7Y9LQL4_9MICC|nr:hypothetical protein [Psychromicrobium silvestre]NYE93795.1 hypothetical protein [Psychromicrobium silvestre]